MDAIFSYRHTEPVATTGGALQGMKLALPSTVSVAGWPTDAGSPALAGFTAVEDATVTQRLRQAGATLCGLTRSSAFGFSLAGSQAGAAVVQHAADAELVLDIMGESRVAAARAELCGFKPSYGLVSRAGLIGLIPSMECCGIIGRSPDTLRTVLATLAGQDGRDFSLPSEPPLDFAPKKIVPNATTLGVITETRQGLSPEQAVGFDAALASAQAAGFAIKELSLPAFDLFTLVHKIVGSVEASSCAGRYDSVRYGPRTAGAKNWNDMYLLSRGTAFDTLLKSYLFQGAFFQFEQYAAYENACRFRTHLNEAMQRLTNQVDALVLPVTDIPDAAATASASLAATYALFSSTLFANGTGQPALVLPPLPEKAHSAVQLTGLRRDDARLLSLGECLLDLRQGGK